MEERKEIQIVLTCAQSKEIAKTGKCDYARMLGGFPFVFHLERGENGKVAPVSVECDLSRYDWDIIVRK